MPIKFPYKFIPGSKGVTPRPVIPIQIGLDEQSATHGFFALIDSGADFCIFSPTVAAEIGITDITKGPKDYVTGVVAGAKSEYYMHRIVLKVGGWPYAIDVAFMPAFTNLGYGILGEKGFFEHFIVRLNLRKTEIELKRYDS